VTDFLYPFLEGRERDPAALLADLAASAAAKLRESAELADRTIARLDDELGRIAGELATRLGSGGTLFTFGNGGSATDAASLAALAADPPAGVPLAARCLAADPAVLTALANDIGFERVFSRQLIAHARPGDVALGISTSGDSDDLLAAFAEARRRGVLTIALAGGGGGRCAVSPDVDHCLVVDSDSVHRIQEAQAALGVALWSRVQDRLGEGLVRG